MATHTHTTPTRKVRRSRKPSRVTPETPHSAAALPALPAMPPKTAAEQAINRELLDRMRELTAKLHQQNLDNAVLLAQMAATGRMAAMGEPALADHFAELGRRFYELLKRPTPRKSGRGLRVIDGGAA